MEQNTLLIFEHHAEPTADNVEREGRALELEEGGGALIERFTLPSGVKNLF